MSGLFVFAIMVFGILFFVGFIATAIFELFIREPLVVSFSKKLRILKRTAIDGSKYHIQGEVFGIWVTYRRTWYADIAGSEFKDLAETIKNRNTPDEVLKEQEL